MLLQRREPLHTHLHDGRALAGLGLQKPAMLLWSNGQPVNARLARSGGHSACLHAVEGSAVSSSS